MSSSKDFENLLKNLEGAGGVIKGKLLSIIEKYHWTIENIAILDVNFLEKILENHKIPRASSLAIQMILKARELLKKSALFVSADEYEKEILPGHISTGVKALDNLLGGGIALNHITDIFGPPGCGKSQIAYQLAVTTQLPKERGGQEGKVVWLDTEGTFVPARLDAIAKRYGLDIATVRKNIKAIRILDKDIMAYVINEQLPQLLNEFPAKLIIIDSFQALTREDTSRDLLPERSRYYADLITSLQKIADIYKLAIVTTTHVMGNPAAMPFGPQEAKYTAVGAMVFKHAIFVQLAVKKLGGVKRGASVIDAPHLPNQVAVFEIYEDGLRDESKSSSDNGGEET